MKLPTGVAADWDAKLPGWRDELMVDAEKRAGSWCYRELPIGWKFGVLLGENGCTYYRFRTPQYRDLTPNDFRDEAARLMGVLGAGDWPPRSTVRRLFWEVTFSQPAPPAPPKEA